MLKLKAVLGLNSFIELIEHDLFYDHRQVVFDKGRNIRFVAEGFYARPGTVQFVLEIIVADGIAAVVTYDKVAFGGRQQLSFCSAFEVGIGGLFAGAGVFLYKLFNPFSQPQLMYQVDVESVAEVFFH